MKLSTKIQEPKFIQYQVPNVDGSMVQGSICVWRGSKDNRPTLRSYFAALLFIMIAAPSFSQRPPIISYFEEMHDLYQPTSLAKPLPADTALKVGNYYAAYRFKGKPVHNVKQISSNKLVTELQYTYAKGKIANIIVEKHSDSTYSKCLVANKEIMRHTQCFDRNDKIVSEEWYNTKTTEYNLATFDSTGVANFTEWGRYSPPEGDDHQ